MNTPTRPTGPSAVGPGPALPPAGPPDELLAAAKATLGNVAQKLADSIITDLWTAAKTYQQCGDKILNGVRSAVRDAQAYYQATGDQVELSLYGLLGAAVQLAGPWGCQMPTQAEILATQAQLPTPWGTLPAIPSSRPATSSQAPTGIPPQNRSVEGGVVLPDFPVTPSLPGMSGGRYGTLENTGEDLTGGGTLETVPGSGGTLETVPGGGGPGFTPPAGTLDWLAPGQSWTGWLTPNEYVTCTRSPRDGQLYCNIVPTLVSGPGGGGQLYTVPGSGGGPNIIGQLFTVPGGTGGPILSTVPSSGGGPNLYTVPSSGGPGYDSLPSSGGPGYVPGFGPPPNPGFGGGGGGFVPGFGPPVGGGGCPPPVVNVNVPPAPPCPPPVINVPPAQPCPPPTINVDCSGGGGGSTPPPPPDTTPPGRQIGVLPEAFSKKKTTPFDLSLPGGCDELKKLLDWAPLTGKDGLLGFLPEDWFNEDKEVEEVASDITPEDIGPVFRPLVKVFLEAMMGVSRAIADGKDDLTGCDGKATRTLRLWLWFERLLGRFLGVNNEAAEKRARYALTMLCPVDLPGPAQVQALFNQAQIDRETFRCLMNANGLANDIADQLQAVSATHLSNNDLLEAYRRDLIGLRVADQKIHENGVASDLDRGLLFALDKVELSQGETLQGAALGIWSEFGERWKAVDDQWARLTAGPAAAYAQRRGVQGDTWKLLGRLRTRFPSSDAMIVYQRRLNTDTTGGELAITDLEIRQQMEREGVPPIWQDRIMVASKPLLPRQQLRRLYVRGQLSDDQLVAQLNLSGIDTELIAAQVGELRQERVLYWSKDQVGKAYLSGLINRTQVETALVNVGMPVEIASKVGDQLQLQLTLKESQRCAGLVRSRYLTGEITAPEAATLLINGGVEAGQAAELVRAWTCGMGIRSKPQAASKLCQWASDGLISAAEFAARLVRLGYSPQDTARIVSECSLKLAERQAALAARQAAQAARAAEKRAAAAAKAAQAAAKAKAAQAKAARAAKRAVEKQDARIAKLAIKAAKAEGQSADLERADITREAQALVAHNGFTADGALDLIEQAIDQVASAKAGKWLDVLPIMLRQLFPSTGGAPPGPGSGTITLQGPQLTV